MSSFTRKWTISKSSGPTHSNSYAMRGVPVRYKTPIFVPELLQLPSDWTMPSLPSMQSFTYDFKLERKVSEQARHRAVSIAAEASLQRNKIAAFQKQLETSNNNKEMTENLSEQASPQMAHTFISSTDILTPTPVALPTPVNSAVVGETDPIARSEDGSTSTISTHISANTTDLMESESQATSTSDKRNSEAVFKSLGNWSIKEFEGDTMDPFEIASLQAINDMEELQSVWQPVAPPIVALPGTANPVPPVSQSAALLNHPPGVQSSSTVSTASQLITNTHSTGNVISNPLTSNSSPEFGVTRINAQPQIYAPEDGVGHSGSSPLPSNGSPSAAHPARANSEGSNNPFSAESRVTSVSTSTNPFRTTEEMPSMYPPVFSISPITMTAPPLPPLQQHGSEVGTLVDISGVGATSHAQPQLLAAADSPKLQHSGGVPIPAPRKKRSPSPVRISPRGSGSVAAVSTSHPSPVVLPSPPTPAKRVRAAAAGIGNTSPTVTPRKPSNESPSFSGTRNHPRSMGVPVLPSITPSSSTASQVPSLSEHPPAYQLQPTPPNSHRASPPPPYSSPSNHSRQQQQHPPPKPPPKTYKLPDPEKSLTLEQREQAKTISSMGFPLHRVGRAILKFGNDQSQILDFLCMVGELSDTKSSGDSAETALIVCENDPEKAKEYIKKLGVYRDIGFSEKDIHRAYPEAEGDWDLVLDILTRDS